MVKMKVYCIWRAIHTLNRFFFLLLVKRIIERQRSCKESNPFTNKKSTKHHKEKSKAKKGDEKSHLEANPCENQTEKRNSFIQQQTRKSYLLMWNKWEYPKNSSKGGPGRAISFSNQEKSKLMVKIINLVADNVGCLNFLLKGISSTSANTSTYSHTMPSLLNWN